VNVAVAIAWLALVSASLLAAAPRQMSTSLWHCRGCVRTLRVKTKTGLRLKSSQLQAEAEESAYPLERSALGDVNVAAAIA